MIFIWLPSTNVYLPKIQEMLGLEQSFVPGQNENRHPLDCHHLLEGELHAGQLQNPAGIELRSEDISHDGVEGFVNDNEVGFDSDRLVFDLPSLKRS